MARRTAARHRRRKAAPKRRFRARIPRLLPGARARRRWLRAFLRWPLPVQLVGGLALLVSLSLAVNWTYQVVRKPSELFFPVSGKLYKLPSQTWETYAPLFKKHATSVVTPDLLAALAQVEGSGNPVVRTYWRWSFTAEPFEIYRPASSAVGMYQLTDGTFAEARRYCIHRHEVVEDGPWNNWQSCWFNGLYTRVVPSHAIELTSAYLHQRVTQTLARHGILGASLRQKQDLAAVIHLCGAGAGSAYARRGLKPTAGQRCGAHDLAAYLSKVSVMKRRFAGFETG